MGCPSDQNCTKSWLFRILLFLPQIPVDRAGGHPSLEAGLVEDPKPPLLGQGLTRSKELRLEHKAGTSHPELSPTFSPLVYS